MDRVPRKAMSLSGLFNGQDAPQRALSFGIVSDIAPGRPVDAALDKLFAAILKAPFFDDHPWRTRMRPQFGRHAEFAAQFGIRPPICAPRSIPPWKSERPARESLSVRPAALSQHFDEFKPSLIPYPLPGIISTPRSPRGPIETSRVWAEMDRLGFDGVGLNEHHTTPHGLMNSPNMMAAVGAQHTKRLKFLHARQPPAAAQSAAHRRRDRDGDCMSRGRVLPGFARGIPREYDVYQVTMSESRARFEEAFEIILKAWTEEGSPTTAGSGTSTTSRSGRARSSSRIRRS